MAVIWCLVSICFLAKLKTGALRVKLMGTLSGSHSIPSAGRACRTFLRSL